jgi:hypothetical protein
MKCKKCGGERGIFLAHPPKSPFCDFCLTREFGKEGETMDEYDAAVIDKQMQREMEDQERPIVKYCKDCAHQEVCYFRIDEGHDCLDFLSGPTKDTRNVKR